MPVAQEANLQIKVKKGSKGARGTEQADRVIDILIENWDQIQNVYKSKSEDEQEELLAHFESIHNDLGDCLFGENASAEDVKLFVQGKPNAEQDRITVSIQEALEVELVD